MRLADAYDAFLLDLDGVVYRGERIVSGASDAIAALRDGGKRVVFLTNNSARTPQQVADKLLGMGVSASPSEVVTSAQATASLVAGETDGRLKSAFVIGEEGVRNALIEAGIDVLDGEPERVGFVVVGWDRQADYDKLRTATILVSRGARLVATNSDASYPGPGGELWPGAGALLATVETASGAKATVVGKPHRALFETALERAGTGLALMVGDRIETDVAGATTAGLDAALVLSGAAAPADLLVHDFLPIAVLADLGALTLQHSAPPIRAALQGDLEAVRALTEAPVDVPIWGPEGVVVAGERDVLATATAEVRGANAYLRGVAVQRELRGKNLGTLMVAAAVRDARAAGALWCYLLTDTAGAFFVRLGFELCGRGALPSWIEGVGGPGERCPDSAVAMVRRIA